MKVLKFMLALTALLILTSRCADEEDFKTKYNDCKEDNEVLSSRLNFHGTIIDKINNELDNAYTLFENLNETYSLDAYNSDSSGLLTLETMISSLDSALLNTHTIIDSLQMELSNKYSTTLQYTRIIDDLRIKLKEKETELSILRELNKNLEVSIITQEHKTDSLIDDFRKERNKLTKELNDLTQRSIKMQQIFDNNVSAFRKEMAENYFHQGNELMNLFANTSSGVFGSNKDTKRNQLKLAYTLFYKACELGHTEAASNLNYIISHKEYSKYLRLKPSGSFNLNSQCGIPPE